PAGDRSLSLAIRSAGFGGTSAAEHLERAGRELLLIGQIESAEGVAALPDLLARFPRIDLWFLGSLDLSVSLGHPGQTSEGPVLEALQNTGRTIRAAGAFLGVYAKDVDEAQVWIGEGATMIAVGSDYAMLASQARAVAQAWRTA
ncbi:MAG: aldolase/citrate lyase family protein, partial [Variovorax sp.]